MVCIQSFRVFDQAEAAGRVRLRIAVNQQRMHFTLARMVPLISLLAQHSTWNIGWSHAPCPLADPNTCKYIVRRRLLSHLPLTAWPILQRPTVFQWSYPTGVETWHLINMVLYLQAVGHAY